MSRVALVTGGNRGIGLAIAQALSDDGHRVAVTYRSEGPDDDRLLAVNCDVTNSEAVDRAFTEVEEKLGPVEILVSNAGITKDGLLLRMSEDDFTSVLDANLTAGYRVAKRATRAMMKGRWGRIVFVSSVVGLGGQAGQANYAASKAGLVGLGRSLAKEFASRNITVNIVAPGPVKTEMIDALNDNQREAMLAAVPLGRFAEPSEIASAVTFLADDSAGYITGAVIPVDGGLAMG
jgi:3-oxoacyl-(acyl-carrier-protein) reductase